MNITELKAAAAKAADLAKQLVADEYHGASQFVAGIRSTLDHANELIAHHEQWQAANPPVAPAETKASTITPAA
jgi:hypothetical protein